MKNLYVVMGGMYYEGVDRASVELFKSQDSAEDYASFLEILEGYDYSVTVMREVK